MHKRSKQVPSYSYIMMDIYSLASFTWLTLPGVRNHSPSDDDYYGNHQAKGTSHDQSYVPF